MPPLLDGLGVKPRLGQLVMIAGHPGAGKSALALWWVLSMNLPTWYASADMDQFDAFTRSAAYLSGDTVNGVGEGVNSGASGYYEDIVSEHRISFSFDSSPTVDDLHLELDAYVETWDEFPAVIVVDNLLNVQGAEEYQGQNWIMQELHRLARETGSTVFVLHHVSQASHADSTTPAASKDIQNKVTQFPEVVLTVALNQQSQDFGVACVKNRNGKADATGKSPIWLRALPERADFVERPAQSGYGNYWSEVE